MMVLGPMCMGIHGLVCMSILTLHEHVPVCMGILVHIDTLTCCAALSLQGRATNHTTYSHTT